MRKLTFFIFILFFIVIYDNAILAKNQEFVSFINALFDEKEGIVIINWEPLDNPKISYKVYRVAEPLAGSQFTAINAEMIKELDYQNRQTSDIPPKTGKYYYFVSTFYLQEENLTLIADQNYTLNPVEFFKPAPHVTNLTGKLMYQSSEILLKWKNPNAEKEPIKEYYLYRSKEIIHKESLKQATKIATLTPDQEIYFDKITATGKFYYAISSVSLKGYESNQWVLEENSLSQPISIAAIDAKKLPEFYIDFPVSIVVSLEPQDHWLMAPEDLYFPSLETKKDYTIETQKVLLEKEENLQKEDIKKQDLADKKTLSKEKEEEKKEKDIIREIVKEKGLNLKEIEAEVDKINAVFSDYYRNKEYDDFIRFSWQEEKNLKSGYAIKKLLFFRALSYYYLNRPAQAALIIKELKKDERFMKHNYNKILLLENKIREKK